VVQETVLSIAKKMPTYVYDPARCSFKGWLKHVTRLRIIDQLRKRHPEAAPLHPTEAETATSNALERIPDPRGLALEQIWNEEWEQNLMDAAMERVKAKAKAEQYQIFYMQMVQNISALEVARMLGINLGKVYFACRRISKMIKQERQRLEKAAPQNYGSSAAI
jgi:RNA polymerase sigma factor (sigma-70 family)